MRTLEADVAVVGSGIAGLLVARALLAAGKRALVLERGGMKSHAEQLRDEEYAADVEGARPNHEAAPGTRDYPWTYVYGVGGSSLHWTGVTPRFHPDDFRLRSRHGVMVDWPFGYDELLPFYLRAERVLGVAGAPGSERDGGQSPHPYSPMDRLVAPHLRPYVPLPQARPTRSIDGRPACCGAAVCELCPVDSRFSVLNGLRDVLEHVRLELKPQTVVERVRLARRGRRVEALEALEAPRQRVQIRASTYVLAAGGFENPALLLRSGLERPDVGRFLFDHAHRTVLVRVARAVGAGRGNSLSTGASHAFREGSFRSKRSAAYVSPYNPGIGLSPVVVAALLSGRRGEALKKRVREEWRRTIPFDVLVEDRPRPARRVALSPNRDAFGLPRISVAYPPPTGYELGGVRAVREGLERRLAPLKVRAVGEQSGPRGAHALGTCRMGDGDTGVVAPDLRHLDVENLFVLGGSAFPTYSPVHPTLTIAALAIRLGDHLARGE